MSRSATWYLRRLRGMSPGEVLQRVGDRGRQALWARRRVAVGADAGPVRGVLAQRSFTGTLPVGVADHVSPAARAALVAAADRMLAGGATVLGFPRPDVADPDWFLDPVSGRRAPQDVYAFAVDHRDEAVTGNVKAVWELSRHHHLTVLAAAWWLTGEDRYADAVAAQLRSWWAANPFLSGVHWTSGIELGVRVTSWVWVRRLLDGWPGVRDLFEDNDDALRQIRWHQEYLAAFRSRGSSANNHVVAEAVGRLVAACGFPWFEESEGWRADAAQQLERELAANTFPSGLNREQATDYHRFVTELGLVALAEADRAGHPLGRRTRALLTASLDAAASVLDVAGRPPRQGDGDEGRALVLDDPETDPWAVLLSEGAAVLGPAQWWPSTEPSVAGAAFGSLVPSAPVAARPASAPDGFADGGLYLLRTPRGEEPELWCRCDGGPHGFLSIAAHGHADALALEVRCEGVDLLVDPGTYCYHGEAQWRSYFRSTLAHNTIEVDGENQSVEGGPFLWSSRTDATTDEAGLDGPVQTWAGHHTGYARLDPALRHERKVTLDTVHHTLGVTDTLTASAPHTLRLAWHLGPEVEVLLRDGAADLTWGTGSEQRSARLRLPAPLAWSAHRGESDPVLGWYSPRFGVRVPTTTLVGAGSWTGELTLQTVLELVDVGGAEAREGSPTVDVVERVSTRGRT
ncbi:Heparinase II/III N-terminus [Pedococcus cremeus]|uniref:Heparinase II/III N-terminus n=1 Tax=Pedococcus cremeus TaxID=587636 RepID=A0A1H9XUS0_9MICO|nr:alginate lyase family protein [Pedococcus cremeus]SES49876.1 Heparinase II/III N-terminus [Pedococcus cremeus]